MMDGIAITDPYLFLRDQQDGSWMAVIVAFTDRNPKSAGVSEVITYNELPSREAAQNWAAEIIGPLGETVYVAPEHRS